MVTNSRSAVHIERTNRDKLDMDFSPQESKGRDVEGSRWHGQCGWDGGTGKARMIGIRV